MGRRVMRMLAACLRMLVMLANVTDGRTDGESKQASHPSFRYVTRMRAYGQSKGVKR